LPVPWSNCIHADRAIRASDDLEIYQEAIEQHSAPEFIRSDNGPEFIANTIQEWLRENKIITLNIDPGSPWYRSRGSYVGIFNGRLREECLDRELIFTLSESRVDCSD
jgi:putative transposase